MNINVKTARIVRKGGLLREVVWQQMKSTDWKMVVNGKHWAEAFVWKTKDQGWACAANGNITQYAAGRDWAMILATTQWSES